jgi:hypothetical protein
VITEPVNAPQIRNRATMETTDAKRFGDTALSSPKVTVFSAGEVVRCDATLPEPIGDVGEAKDDQIEQEDDHAAFLRAGP